MWLALLSLNRDVQCNVVVSLHPLLPDSGLPVWQNGSGVGRSGSPGNGTEHEQLELRRALRTHGMLADRAAGASLLPLVELADVVIAPVSSGSGTVLLQSPETPLVMLRPRTAWDNVSTEDTAAANAGLVLGPTTAVVLHEHLDAAALVAAVEQELRGGPGVEARAVHRRRHRKYWFGTVDGYEELRTWLALLVTMVEPAPALAGNLPQPAGAETHALPGPGAVHFSQKGCCRTSEQRARQREGEKAARESVRAQLGALATGYTRLLPPDGTGAAATTEPRTLADPTDHPMMWGKCSGICDGDGGDYR